MRALSDLSNKAGARAQQENLWYYILGAVNSVMDLDIALGGSYYLATECHSPVTFDDETVKIYSYASIDIVAKNVRDYFNFAKVCEVRESKIYGGVIFAVSFDGQHCTIGIEEAPKYLKEYEDLSLKVLIKEYLIADEITNINVTGVACKYIVDRIYSAITNSEFNKFLIGQIVERIAGDGIRVYSNLIDTFIKQYSKGMDADMDNKIINIIGFVSNALYKCY